jgi:uncharacterized integral membrane protein
MTATEQTNTQRRSDRAFPLPQVYIALQAIVQGASLKILTDQTLNGNGLADIAIWWIYALACLSYVIYIAFQYMLLFAGPYGDTRINALDIAIVVMLGILEFIPMYQVKKPENWTAPVLVLAVAGSAAFWGAWWQLRERRKRMSATENWNQAAHSETTRYTLIAWGALILMSVVVFVVWNTKQHLFGMDPNFVCAGIVFFYCLCVGVYGHVFLARFYTKYW